MKTIEAVLFNNELELLEARFHEGDDVVDHWVIIESDQTFTGHHKQPVFLHNHQKFGRFNDRVTHYKATGTPYGTPWEREAGQRDTLELFLGGLDDDDLVVLSDADELTRASCWPEIVAATENGESVSLHKPTWYYTLTWALPDAGPAFSSFRSKAARVQTLREYGSVAKWADDLSFPVIANSGWHLSCLGGPSRLLSKIRSFSHQEINTSEWATYENCRRMIQDGVDCAPGRNATLTRTVPSGPDWLITEGVAKYPWLLSGEDACILPS